MKIRSMFKGLRVSYVLPLVFLCTSIIGCTAYYTQKGKGTADFERDKKYCEKVAQQEAARKGTRVCDEVDRCLINTKGWKRE